MSMFDGDAFNEKTTETLGNIGKGFGESTEVLGLIFDDILNKGKRLARAFLIRK